MRNFFFCTFYLWWWRQATSRKKIDIHFRGARIFILSQCRFRLFQYRTSHPDNLLFYSWSPLPIAYNMMWLYFADIHTVGIHLLDISCRNLLRHTTFLFFVCVCNVTWLLNFVVYFIHNSRFPSSPFHPPSDPLEYIFNLILFIHFATITRAMMPLVKWF